MPHHTLLRRGSKLGSKVGILFWHISNLTSFFSQANYDGAMRIVAYTEIVIFVRVLLGAITFQNSLLAPIIFVHFLRMRYFQSAFTREAIADWGGKADAYIRKPGNPPAVVRAWDQGQGLMKRWAGVVLTPNAEGPRR